MQKVCNWFVKRPGSVQRILPDRQEVEAFADIIQRLTIRLVPRPTTPSTYRT